MFTNKFHSAKALHNVNTLQYLEKGEVTRETLSFAVHVTRYLRSKENGRGKGGVE